MIRGIFIFLIFLKLGSCEKECIHRLYEVKGSAKPGSNGFSIEIAAQSEAEGLHPSGYVPGKSYKSKLLSIFCFLHY